MNGLGMQAGLCWLGGLLLICFREICGESERNIMDKDINDETLESIYQEKIEERIIEYLAEICELSYENAIDIYYSSKLSDKIYLGKYGIQYLDYKVLVQILLETEEELFD